MGAAKKFVAEPPLRWVAACDESGIDGKSSHYGFGSLWMKEQRRGDLHRKIQELRDRHRYTSEAKWTSLRPFNLPFYIELVDFFFKTNWLCFHSIVVPKALVDRRLHGGKMETAWAKHFTMLLTNKIQRSLRKHPHREQHFRIWVDPLPSSYAKADERMQVIAKRVLDKAQGQGAVVEGVHTHDSKDTPAIQLCDVLLGAVLAAWRGEATGPAKVALSKAIAAHLGWDDLNSDTFRTERKFNTWMFYPDRSLPRVLTRRVQLNHPYP